MWPNSALEISVQGGGDGTIWAQHDAYFDRMVLGSSGGTTMPVVNYTASQVANLQQTAQFTNNPNVPTRPVAKLTDLLAQYGGKRVIFIEPKGNVSTSSLLTLMNQYGGTDWFVWKWPGNTAIPSAVTSAGYDTWGYYFNGSDMTNFNSTQGNFTFVGLDFNLSNSALSSAIALAGASRVIGHIIGSTTQRDRFLTAGVRGLMVSAPRVVLLALLIAAHLVAGAELLKPQPLAFLSTLILQHLEVHLKRSSLTTSEPSLFLSTTFKRRLPLVTIGGTAT